jgi:hypothetical protein
VLRGAPVAQPSRQDSSVAWGKPAMDLLLVG